MLPYSLLSKWLSPLKFKYNNYEELHNTAIWITAIWIIAMPCGWSNYDITMAN